MSLASMTFARIKRIIAPLLLLAVAALLLSCSGSKTFPSPAMPSIGGAWEFVAASTTNLGYSTGIEVALQQGVVFNTQVGNYNPTGQISAAGPQLIFIGINGLTGNPNTPPTIVFGGNCTPASSNPGDTLSGSISGLAGSMNFTYTEAGNVFSVSATLSSDGKSMLGTYTEQAAQAGQSNGVCNGDSAVLDMGNITGTVVSKLSGANYLGKICRPSDTSCALGAVDNATASLSESSGNLTLNMVLTGADNATFTLTGPVAGNAFSVQGTFGGAAVIYDGYFHSLYDKSDGLYDIPTFYLGNVDFSSGTPTPTFAGTLQQPLTP